jgi:quercetin dioxygenase-like cupin family protein
MPRVTDYPLNWDELGELLKEFRDRKGLSRPQMAEILQQNLSDDPKPWLPLKKALIKYRGRFIRLIEENASNLKDSLKWKDDDATTLARLYGVTPLMLDWLRSENTDAGCLVITENDWVKLRQRNPKYYGSGTKYSVPVLKYPMGVTDVAFGLLELTSAKSGSAAHSHPGEEILICRKGLVQVQFPHSGIWVDLRPGDLVHFWSEMNHKAISIAPKSTLFVVRYYQVVRPGTRSVIRTSFDGNGTAPSKVLNQLTRVAIRDEILEAEDERVADPIGLGRLLERIAMDSFRGPKRKKPTIAFKKLVQSLRDAKVSIQIMSAQSAKTVRQRLLKSKTHFIRLHHGELTIKKSDLGKLAKVYGVEPMIFYDYLHFSEPGVVAVRQKEYRSVHLVKKTGVQYLACGRRLALSDIAILRVCLKSGKCTPENFHAGFEAIVATKGSVTVELHSTERHTNRHRVGSKPGEYAFFNSSRTHAVKNEGRGLAEFFVLRFYQ